MDQDKNPGQQGQRPQDQPDQPNQNANKEPAEGSREDIRSGKGGSQNPEPDQEGAGISNRPADREKQEQKELPPRGQTKNEDRNA